jgi:hypothetical protein
MQMENKTNESFLSHSLSLPIHSLSCFCFMMTGKKRIDSTIVYLWHRIFEMIYYFQLSTLEQHRWQFLKVVFVSKKLTIQHRRISEELSSSGERIPHVSLLVKRKFAALSNDNKNTKEHHPRRRRRRRHRSLFVSTSQKQETKVSINKQEEMTIKEELEEDSQQEKEKEKEGTIIQLFNLIIYFWLSIVFLFVFITLIPQPHSCSLSLYSLLSSSLPPFLHKIYRYRTR